MDIAFYILISFACVVLLFAMWACAAEGINKWGPDLTLELPPEVIHDALFPSAFSKSEKKKLLEAFPSAPTELPDEPLLSHAQPLPCSDTQSRVYSQPITYSDAPPRAFLNTAVRVLPTNFMDHQKMRPPIYSFSQEEPA